MKKGIWVLCVLVIGVWGSGLFAPEVVGDEVQSSTESLAEEKQEGGTLEPSRALELLVHEPTLTGHELRSLLRKSRHYQGTNPGTSVESLEREEAGDSPGEALRSALRHEPVSPAEETAYFNANRTLFGDRSFEQSRHTIQRLIRIEKVGEKFAL